MCLSMQIHVVVYYVYLLFIVYFPDLDLWPLGNISLLVLFIINNKLFKQLLRQSNFIEKNRIGVITAPKVLAC